jgi:DNA-binding protein H-NS
MARNGIDLESYTVRELRELRERIEAAIEAQQKSERVALRAKMQELAAASGLTLEEVLGVAKRGRVGKGSVAAKYRNPEDPSQTWTGRGRMPLWLAEKLKKRGTTKDDFAV